MDAYTKSSSYAVHSGFTTYRQVTGADPTVRVNSDTHTSAIRDTFSGYKNPNWRSEIRNGQNATTPASGVKHTGQPSWMSAGQDCYYRSKNPPYTYFRYYYEIAGYANPLGIISGLTPSSSVTTSVTNRCISRFIENVQSIQSSIEAGQDLGEYRETVESIHHPLASLRNKLVSYISSLTKAKSKYKRRPLSLPQVLADTYLEFRFGVDPLVDDVAQAIATAGAFRFKQYPVSSSAHQSFSGSSGTYVPTDGYWATTPRCRQGYVTNGTYSVRYKGAVRSGANASGKLGYVRSLRLLPKDWIPTAWDLLPYSWVADYFANIGDILQALSFVYSDLLWGCKTVRTSTTTRFSDFEMYQWFVPPDTSYVTIQNNYWANGGSTSYEVTSFSRSSLNPGDLVPRFQFRIPTSKYPYLNLAALLIGRASKIVPFFLPGVNNVYAKVRS